MGPKFVTIETDDTQGLTMADTIKVVPYSDIYSTSTVLPLSTQSQGMVEQPLYQGLPHQGLPHQGLPQQGLPNQGLLPLQQPAINIKVVNGTDNSIDTSNPSTNPGSTIVNPNSTIVNPSKNSTAATTDEPKKMDEINFNNLVIKKV